MSVFGPDLVPATEPASWEWVPSALGEWGTIGGLVPARSFERCVRIDDGGDLDDGSDDEGSDDEYRGWGLRAPVLNWIVATGTDHTTTRDQARFAIWEGYGWLTSTLLYARKQSRRRFGLRRRTDPFGDAKDEFEQRKADLASELATLPMLQALNRAYHLLGGPLSAATTMHDPIPPSRRQPPDLWWPADRAWFVGSDTDLTWTYVAGSAAFIEQIVDAWPDRARLVGADDPIA